MGGLGAGGGARGTKIPWTPSEEPMQHTLQRQERGVGGGGGANSPQPSPLWDFEVCMPM